MTYQQEPPFCVQIELAEGCNLFCTFCGLRGIRTGGGKDLKFMSLDRAVELAEIIGLAQRMHGWNPRLEFAMHGEPTMNPDWLDIMRVFRGVLPDTPIMITTNGGGLLRKPGVQHWITSALRYVNVLAIDAYESVKIYEKIQAGYNRPIGWYPDDPHLSPHRRRGKREPNLVVFIRDIALAKDGNHAHLNNHAGAAFPKNQRAAGKRCAKPFRELSIRYDGNVALCCNDWRGEYKCGNVFDTGDIAALWNNPAFTAARHKLYHGQRDFGACNGCDALSYRTGFLPDQKGKHELPEPTAEHLDIIAQATAGAPYTPPVLREWELK